MDFSFKGDIKYHQIGKINTKKNTHKYDKTNFTFFQVIPHRGKTIEDFSVIKIDNALRKLTGMGKMPSTNSISFIQKRE